MQVEASLLIKRGIEKRPGIAERKSRIGDWEGDTIIDAYQKGVILSLVDRCSKYTRLTKLPNKTTQGVTAGAIQALKGMKRKAHTITFDNRQKIFSFTNSGIGISLDFDDIVIGREVFADGVNRYSINGTEVRLKDIVDLLSSVNIGSSGHHIISQI